MAKTLAKKTVAAPAKAVKLAKKTAAPKAAKKVRAQAAEVAPLAAKAADIIENIQPKVKEAMTDTANTAKNVFEKGTKLVKDVVEFQKDNAAAIVESGKIAAKGAQEIGQFAMDHNRKNWDATTAMFKSAAAVKSPTDLFKLQGEFARDRFDFGVAQFSKTTEMFVKLAGEVAQPLQSRYAVAAEEVKGYAL
jgi:phasin family protein